MSRSARGFFIAFTLVALILIASVTTATYLTEPAVPMPRTYTAQEGDTWENIALRYDVTVSDLLRANRLTQASRPVRDGEALVIPPPAPALIQVWRTHGLGVLAEVVGVAIGLWLSRAAGLMPKRIRGGSWVLSLAIAAASYATTHVVAATPVTYVSPGFIFAAVKDGFFWSSSMPLVARAFGTSRRRR
jgi:LysM repeat protein